MSTDQVLVVEGKILDIHLDAGEIVLILEVGTAWRIRPPEPVPNWRKTLLRPGESWPRFRGDPSLVNRSVYLGQPVTLLTTKRGDTWTISALDVERTGRRTTH